MKNRKTVVVAFLLVAAMLLGVGYAALTDTLTIDGTIQVGHENAEDAFEKDVYFSNVTSGTGYTASINVDSDPDKADFTVDGLNTLGDDGAITITYTVRNDNAFVVYANFANTFSDEHFDVSLDRAQYEIPASGSVNVTVTVKMVKAPTVEDGDPAYEATGLITFTVTEVAPQP